MNRGFSLVELSIVLVILGLLTGGILAGQSLIRAAELRAISTEHGRYLAAVQSFRDKYFALPGDFNIATKFWGKDTAVCNSAPEAAGTPGTCNGDGDGLVQFYASSNENFRFWQHLALAGLIEGSYSGVEGSAGNVYHTVPGTNAPRSKLGNAVWFARDFGNRLGHPELFDGAYGNSLLIGAVNGISQPYGALLKPEEAWNLDIKIDDGKPGSGGVVPGIRSGCAAKADGSAITNSAADAALSDATYALSTTSAQCALVFRRAY